MEAKRQPSARSGPEPLRLTPEQAAIIRSAAAEAFGSDARVWLFGSRVDDSKRGGDIDLLIETRDRLAPAEMVRRRTRCAARLYRGLGEQRIGRRFGLGME